ncbi:MAG: hypothetical protein ACM3JG_12730, partial [Thiohalocapsa sp.]
HMARSHRMRHHAGRSMARRGAGHRGGQMNDNIADQLNREEASRLSGSSTPPTGSQMPPTAPAMGAAPTQTAPAVAPPARGPRASSGYMH